MSKLYSWIGAVVGGIAGFIVALMLEGVIGIESTFVLNNIIAGICAGAIVRNTVEEPGLKCGALGGAVASVTLSIIGIINVAYVPNIIETGRFINGLKELPVLISLIFAVVWGVVIGGITGKVIMKIWPSRIIISVTAGGVMGAFSGISAIITFGNIRNDPLINQLSGNSIILIEKTPIFLYPFFIIPILIFIGYFVSNPLGTWGEHMKEQRKLENDRKQQEKIRREAAKRREQEIREREIREKEEEQHRKEEEDRQRKEDEIRQKEEEKRREQEEVLRREKEKQMRERKMKQDILDKIHGAVNEK